MSQGLASVLVADDDAGALALMEVALGNAKCHVHGVQSGEAALEQFERNPFDLVMLDVDMPGIGGLETCRRLRQSVGPDLPIVIVTGMDDVASINGAYAAGATDFVAKPVPWALIGHRARYLLRNAEMLYRLRQSEARMEAVLNTLPDIFMEIDGFGYITRVRLPPTCPSDVAAQRMEGLSLYDAFSHASATVFSDALREALEHGTSAGGEVTLGLSGAPLRYTLSMTRLSAAGSAPGFIAVVRQVADGAA